MPNEQTSVPLFASGEVLTAANMNISAGTGVPVFATTVTRDAAFGGTGEKVLAEGQLCYLSSTKVTQQYNGTSWVSVGGGLTLIKSQTITPGVSSVAVTDVFSATYEQYQISVTNVQTSGAGQWLSVQLGSTTTGYYGALSTADFATGNFTGGGNFSNAANFTYTFAISSPATNVNGGSVILTNPFATKRTTMNGFATRLLTTGYAGTTGGFQDSDTSFTGFSLIPTSGTITSGNISVYGLAR